jgi:hypothetical protein
MRNPFSQVTASQRLVESMFNGRLAGQTRYSIDARGPDIPFEDEQRNKVLYERIGSPSWLRGEKREKSGRSCGRNFAI